MGDDEPKPLGDCFFEDEALKYLVGDRCVEDLAALVVALVPNGALCVARTPVDGVLVEKS